jgi:hypothetical protein
MSDNLRRHRQSSPGQPPEILHFSTEEGFEEEQKYETLFTVNEKSYDLWINPPASVGLRYLKMVKEQNQEHAAVWLLEQMIGEDGYAALMSIPNLKASQLEQISKIVKDYAMGDEKKTPPGN